MFELGIIAALIVGLIEALKQTGLLTAKWSALVAIALGVIFFYFSGDGEVIVRVVDGIIAGLTAAGLYSGAKATMLK